MTNPTTRPDSPGTGAAVAPSPLMIIAAGGAIPYQVAAAAMAAGRRVFMAGIDGEADERIRGFPHALIKWGQIGRLDKLAAENGARDVVIVGSISKRPDLRDFGFDLSTLKLVPTILKALAGGDDNVMTSAIRFLEARGLRVIGAHEVATDLVAAAGHLAGPSPTPADLVDAAAALRACEAIGRLDIGQAAIAVNERVVALEAAEGTDAIVRRVGELRKAGRFKWTGRSGVLVKCSKPGQDLRVDMPTIGPKTVEMVAEVGLAGIVIEAGRVMIAERDVTLAAAKRTTTFIRAEHTQHLTGPAR